MKKIAALRRGVIFAFALGIVATLSACNSTTVHRRSEVHEERTVSERIVTEGGDSPAIAKPSTGPKEGDRARRETTEERVVEERIIEP
ncbi:MAG: hypothetical protein SFZ23_00420 [Planctomycetota bacterium]|nr:hypothetical protein [Planctomycetota bacterium]